MLRITGKASFKILVGLGLVVALSALFPWPIFLNTTNHQGLQTAFEPVFKLIDFMSAVGGYFGFSHINLSRSILTTNTNSEKKSKKVERYTTLMDGVEVIVFKPVGRSVNLRPGIVHFRGGGWVLMSADFYAPYCEEVVKQTGSVLVSVNYRLAPKFLYPTPLEDCLTATRYFLKNAGRYGVDKNLIGVKGDSTGGNLAMAIAIKLSKDESLPSLKFMSLDYPALQAFDFELPSYQKYSSGPALLTKKIMINYWLLYAFGHLQYYEMFYENKHTTNALKDSVYGQYVKQDLLPASIRNSGKSTGVEQASAKTNIQEVPEEVTKVITDPFYAPLMASDKDLSVLPPTYLFNVEFDVLRDDGLIAAERMKRAGVKVTKRFITTEEHGYLNFVSGNSSIRAEIERFAVFLNETLKL